MVSTLTRSERQAAIGVSVLVAICGLAFAALGRHDVLEIHGFLILAFGLLCAFAVINGYYEPEPTDERLASYYDAPIKAGIALSMAWAVFALFIGVWVASLLAWPNLTFDQAWASFGRLRPVHTTGIIFGFGGNALIATSST